MVEVPEGLPTENAANQYLVSDKDANVHGARMPMYSNYTLSLCASATITLNGSSHPAIAMSKRYEEAGEYKVSFGYIEWDGVAQVAPFGDGDLYLGNVSAISSDYEETKYPELNWCILGINNNTAYMYTTITGTYSIKIYYAYTDIKTLDPVFIPESIARTVDVDAKIADINQLPETTASHQQLVTDANGVAKWENKPFYDESDILYNGYPKYAFGYAKLSFVLKEDVEYKLGYINDEGNAVGSAMPYVATRNTYGIIGFSDDNETRGFRLEYSESDGYCYFYPEGTVFKDGEPETSDDGTYAYTSKVMLVIGYANDADVGVVPLPEKYLPSTVPVIKSASVGQTIVVKAVDEDGKPTEWEAADQTQRTWSGKTWACMGDSLTASATYTSKFYHDYIAEQTGITIVNMGSGGTGYKKREDEGNAFYQRASSVPSNASVVTIFGSGNDLSLMDVSEATWESVTPTWNTSQYLRGDGSGNIADYAGHDTWVVSEPIPVTPGDIYKLTAGIQYQKSVLVFYDEADGFVSSLTSTVDDAYTWTDEVVTVPDNAAYMRVGNVTTIVTFALAKQIDGSGGIGTPTDTGTNTICGCINTTIDNLYAVLPTVQLGIITPTPWSGYNPAIKDNNMALYSAAIVEICRLRGIPCLDLYHCSALRPWDEAFRDAAYSKDSSGVHPDETGHAIFAPRIKAFLNTLVM